MFIEAIDDGKTQRQEFTSEIDFIESQFVVFQPYSNKLLSEDVNRDILKQFSIYSLMDTNAPLTKRLDKRLDIDQIQMAFKIEDCFEADNNIVRFLLADFEKMTLIKFRRLETF